MPNIDTALLHAVTVLHDDDAVRRGDAVHTATLYPTDTEAVPAGCYCVVTVQVRRLGVVRGADAVPVSADAVVSGG